MTDETDTIIPREVSEVAGISAPPMEPVKSSVVSSPIPVAPTEEQREEARRAMEGAERTEKRAREEQQKKLAAERGALDEQLAEIKQKKEGLELAWIKFDDERKRLREQLAPILKREKEVEDHEGVLEKDEAATAAAPQKHAVEEKRWVIQDERREIEKSKWTLQEKLWKIEQQVEENTKEYRLLLDGEEAVNEKIARLINNGSNL